MLSAIQKKSGIWSQVFTDCQLEYIYFMKNGQPKLSEIRGQRNGLFVPPMSLQSNLTFKNLLIHTFRLDSKPPFFLYYLSQIIKQN